ncbi:TonB family protein [Rufibacter sediminis]|uniref:M56 family metallopeptidase n=1 Tax=Rufibacter sediminis TaxID=2762756 RepID=A0ABR6VT52_9BACT|nr:M56 family metallopeptidase [Rufibacter sediminis]MBC3540376.1 M56 family metallopeptidase [Rufibacter sediminis]
MNEPLLQYLLESGTGLVLFYLFYALVLKRETCFQFNRFYLLAALGLSFLVPLSNLPGIALWPQEPVVVMEASLEEMPLLVSEVAAAPAPTFSYWFLLYGAYGLGALFFAVRAVVQVRQLRRFAKAEGTSFYLPNQAPVILTHGQFPTFSFWRWVFFDNSQTLTPEETDRILQHEQVHIDQRHTLDILLVSVVGVLFWFNPLLLLYKKAVEQTHEFIADAQVARRTGPSAYSSLLVKQVFRTADFPLGSYFFLHKSLTLTRIKMMKKLHQSPKLSRMLMALPVAGLLLVAVAAMRPVLPKPENAAGTVTRQNRGAQFPGGREALNAYVKTHFVLPEVAFQKRKSQNDFVQVKASVEVEVLQDGSAAYLRIVALEVQPKDDAVVKAVEQQFARLVSQMPKWTPAQKDGKAVSSKEIISVSSVSGNFLTYNAYLEGRQQKTSVSSKAAVTKPAEYPGGKEALYQHLNSKFVMPKVVLDARDKADSTIKFMRYIKADLTIGADGSVEDVSVVEIVTRPFQTPDVRNAVEKEFLRLMQQQPKWTPAYKDGKAVASKENIAFAAITKLDGKETFEQAKKEKQATDEKKLVYIAVEQMPEFPGGSAAMFKFLGDHFELPADAKQANIEGTMVASFVVNTQGKVTDIQLLKKLHPSVDQALVQTLEKMPTWKPGTQNGKLVNVKYTVPYRIVSKDKTAPVPTPSAQGEEKVYIAVEQMPEFPGGMAGMMKYLGENFVIPADEKTKGTEGTIVATFVVNKEGKVTQVQVIKGVSSSLDQEAIRVLNNMPAWKPGMQNGKQVAVRYTVPYRIVAKKDADKSTVVPAQKN